MRRMTPRFIFWDWGGTIIESHTSLTMLRLSRLTGTSPQAVSLALARGGTHRSIFELANLGVGSTKKFVRRVRRQLKLDPRLVSNNRIISAFYGTYELSREMCHLLYFLSGQGTWDEAEEKTHLELPMGIISNTTKFAWRHGEDTFPVLRKQTKVFCTYTLSCEVGVLKPQPKIYGVAFDRARIAMGNGLKERQCVFFDDKEENVAAAKDFGFRAFRVMRLREARKVTAKKITPASQISDILFSLGFPLPPKSFQPPKYVRPMDPQHGVNPYTFERVV
jgi:FMN phosphatase YigB (HAD superfamily)